MLDLCLVKLLNTGSFTSRVGRTSHRTTEQEVHVQAITAIGIGLLVYALVWSAIIWNAARKASRTTTRSEALRRTARWLIIGGAVYALLVAYRGRRKDGFLNFYLGGPT